MDSDEAREVIAAMGLVAVLACGVIAVKQWEEIRCRMPPLPNIQWRGSQGSPTPIQEQRL
jgi:hypothetical protein